MKPETPNQRNPTTLVVGGCQLETGWSEFVFEPQAGTMYSIECLVELTAMVRDLNRAHGVKRF